MGRAANDVSKLHSTHQPYVERDCCSHARRPHEEKPEHGALPSASTSILWVKR